MASSILLTGGTGFTSTMMAKLIRAKLPSAELLLASRSGSTSNISGTTGVKMDWEDPSTFENPFMAASASIKKVYLIGPPREPDQLKLMKPFIELCKAKGVERFVLMSSCVVQKGSKWPWGKVHEYLATTDNLATVGVVAIRDYNTISNNVGTGKVPFVSCEDIAECGVQCLIDEKCHNKEHIILGPERLSFIEVASLLTNELGREIKYNPLSDEAFEAQLKSYHVPDGVVDFLIFLNAAHVDNGDEKYYEGPNTERWIGKRRMADFIKEKKDVWVKKE